jgi:hypothetical protein
MNLKDKYTEILAIFQNAKLPKDNMHLYLDELYKMAYNSISKIDDYYLHMELIDNQNTVLKKMKEYHLELLQYYVFIQRENFGYTSRIYS